MFVSGKFCRVMQNGADCVLLAHIYKRDRKCTIQYIFFRPTSFQKAFEIPANPANVTVK
jgi:hypothetical protein